MILPFPNVKSHHTRAGDELMLEAMAYRQKAAAMVAKAQTLEILAITHWAKAEAERFKASTVSNQQSTGAN